MLPLDESAWRSFSERVEYEQLNFDEPAGFDRLAKHLDTLDEERGTRGNRLFYLATQPSQFSEIVAQLGRVGLDHERHDGGWRRVVIEKPFGHDLASAQKLNREVGKVFRESQVYRIDHYLGKETVRNLMVFRFGNSLFEPIWNRRYVDHIQITVAESMGIENRGAFYEETGAARDVLQNHLLQLVSLVGMEPPAAFQADALRDEKVKVLRAIASHPEDVVRGQYGPGWLAGAKVPGYREEAAVDPQSETETFVAARFVIDDWRWSGVPVYVRTGKRLPKRATEIAIQFREVPHRLFASTGSEPDPNLLAIRIQPDEGIMLRFGAKIPGLGLDVRSVTMDFSYGSAFSVDSPDAYETLILDALQGDASLFTRADEVEHAWAIVDPIIESWADADAPTFPNYEAGTWGPPEADDLLAREGRQMASDLIAERTEHGAAVACRRARAPLDLEGQLDRRHRAGAGEDLVAGRPGRARPRGRRRPARRGPHERDEPGRHHAQAGDRRALRRHHPCADRPPPVPDLAGDARRIRTARPGSTGASRRTACCHARTRRRSARR